MTKEELLKTKNLVTVFVFLVTLAYIAIIYLIFTDSETYDFFVKDEPLLFQSDIRNKFSVITVLYVLLVGPISGIYFQKQRKFNIENGTEKELTRNKIDSDSNIRCSNRLRYIFFNCAYFGKPTTRMPLLIKIQKPSATQTRGLIQMSQTEWEKYNSIDHYYCPACGKELFDSNLIENFQPVKQTTAYKFIAVFTVLVLLFNIVTIANFIKNGQIEINTVIFALAIFVISLLALLLTKR